MHQKVLCYGQTKKEHLQKIFTNIVYYLVVSIVLIWISNFKNHFKSEYILLFFQFILLVVIAYFSECRWKLLIKDNVLIYSGTWKNKGLVLTNEAVISCITKDKYELIQGETRIELDINETQAEELRKIITKNN